MSNALPVLADVMMRPLWGKAPAEFREELRSFATLVDRAIREAFETGQLLQEPEATLATLDAAKSVIQRNYLARHRLRQTVLPDAEKALMFTFTKPRFLLDYLARPAARGTAVCCLFMTERGEVWAAVVTLKSGGLDVKTLPVVPMQRASSFLEQLTEYADSLSAGRPNIGALESILEDCGRTLIPQFVGMLYPEKVIFIPHRRLHMVPWHAAYVLRPDRSRVYLGDVVEEISYASSIFELLWANWWPQGSRPRTSVGVLAVIDVSAADLRWVALEHEYALVMQDSGLPLHIVTKPAELPPSLEGYIRIAWSSHASSSPNAWGKSALFLGDMTLEAETIMSTWNLPFQPTVSLAACETGLDLSAPKDSDEYCGLDFALRVAGAGAVMATMWPVADPVAALGNLLVTQYELADGISTSRALSLFQKYLRSGEWHRHLVTEEQMGELATHGSASDKVRPVIRELRKLDPRELRRVEYWACWRCVSA